MHIFVPKFKLKSSQSPKWFTSNIRHQIKCLRTLRKKYKSRPTEHNLLRVKTAEETLQASIQQAKANFEAKLVNNFAFSNDSKIFQYVRNLTKSTSIPSTILYDNTSASQDFDKANLFNKYFYSVFSRSTYSLPNFEMCPEQVCPLTQFTSLKKTFTMHCHLWILTRQLVSMESVQQF